MRRKTAGSKSASLGQVLRRRGRRRRKQIAGSKPASLGQVLPLAIGTLVTALPGACSYTAGAGAGWYSVGILCQVRLKFDLRLLSQCGCAYNYCLRRCVLKIHVACGGDVNSILTMTGKFSVMTGTLLYFCGLYGIHFKLTEEMHTPLKPTPKKDTLRG